MKYFTFQVRESLRLRILSVLLFIVILVCTITAVVVVNKRDDKRLELVQVLFRHGERTARKEEYAVLKYTSPSVYSPFGLGHLTNRGKMQAYDLGVLLRERYRSYLDEVYNEHELSAQSSENDRTKMSLQLVLAGLYPPSWQLQWHPELNWMPLPYRYAPAKLDVLFKPYNSQKFQQIKGRETDEVARANRTKKYSDILKILEEKAGLDVSKQELHFLAALFNSLHVNERMNIPLPEWCTKDLLSRLRDYFIFYLDCMSYTQELKRINGGTLLKKFVENMNLNETLYNPRRMYLYSGHELNLAAVARSIGVQDFLYPDFSSVLIFEKLRDVDNQVYIRLVGRREAKEELRTFKIGNCDELCPVEEFLRITRDVIPTSKEMNYLVDDFKGSAVDDLFLNDPYIEQR